MGSQLRHLNPQGTANVLWALGKLDMQPGEPLLQALTSALWPHLPNFSPQGLSNSVYGLALLGHDPGGSLMDTAAARLLEMIELKDEVCVCCSCLAPERACLWLSCGGGCPPPRRGLCCKLLGAFEGMC